MTEADLRTFLGLEGVQPEGQEVSSIARAGNNPSQVDFQMYTFCIISKDRFDKAYASYASAEFRGLPRQGKALRFI